MAWFMGIDIGSRTSKGIITENGSPSAYHLIPTGANYRVAAEKLREELLTKVGLRREDIARTVTTGHGADIILFIINTLPIYNAVRREYTAFSPP
jgi:activator of 2-hydroxyglutaryl-CoA dehydratase